MISENSPQKRVFVTGATGFVGRNLVQTLVERGYEVVALVRPNSKHEFLKKLPVELVYGDFTDLEALRRCVAGAQTVFHLAGCIMAANPERFMEVNCEYTETLAKICCEQPEPPVFVFVSSLAAAGPSSAIRPHIETDLPAPISYYGKSKLAAENVLRTYAGQLPVTILRPGMIFGPYDHEFRKWFEAIQKTGTFFVPILRPYRMSMIHTEDLCEMLLLAADRGERVTELGFPDTGVYFASQTEHPTYMEMRTLFGTALGRKRTFIMPASPPVLKTIAAFNEMRTRFTGVPSVLNADKCREALAGSWSCSAEKARRQLGFRNLHTLPEQLAMTVAWIRDHSSPF